MRTRCKGAPVRSGSSQNKAKAPDPVVTFTGDSDAHIVRGLVALVLAIYSGKRRSEIAGIDALAIFKNLGLDQHLSPQRSNGLKSMIGRIRATT